ncbi:FAD-dependent oxidoreductase [Cyanobacteria bacterium FACHB-471]|nr:FAD-dependent oxidoreductase [Cyanobacteria bacterium FACHB-471]
MKRSPGVSGSKPSSNRSLSRLLFSLLLLPAFAPAAFAAPPRQPDQEVACEILVVGGGLAGVATAYEGLLAGRTVCLTEITDWLGGQISSQGTSALDERTTQRAQLFYSRGYLELRDRIESHYKRMNPGECWVSESCFFPYDGDEILQEMLEDAADEGNGRLRWFPSTVIKEVDIEGGQIQGAIAIQHSPAPDAPPLNTLPLSQTIEDSYRYEDSDQFEKTIIRFVPQPPDRRSANANQPRPTNWYVVDATETGEIIGLADVPYRLGIDALSYREPSSSSAVQDPYCPQGFTYTFAMEATEEPQTHEMPSFYPQYEPYYSYELPRLANFGLVFNYRRIYDARPRTQGSSYQFSPGDISMQNWTWGNDYRPGTAEDNLIYSRDQLEATGQLESGGWLGGLRSETLRRGEENALGYFYWLVEGETDSQLGEGVKQPNPNHRYLSGLDSPMGTAHGLSKYPYMREGRRILGRPAPGYPNGFSITEIDISRRDYADEYYREALPPAMYRSLRTALAGLEATAVVGGVRSPDDTARRTRSTIYPDAVGIGHYAIDFHPCMALTPPEQPANYERPGERRGAGQAYPFQIPLRSLIPQEIDNLLVAGKSIATSHIAAAAYRVHSFEWSSGAAVGNVVDFALDRGVLPYELVDQIPMREPLLEEFQQRLQRQGNPTAFPNTSIFNEDWEEWQ